MRETGLPFDDIRRLMALMPEPDAKAAEATAARNALLTKPAGALGRLEDLAVWLSAWQAKAPPSCEKPLVAIFAGNHGVAARGVSAYPTTVTAAMVANFRNGGAAINQICETFGAGLRVFELALELPTRDFTQEAAMQEAECAATIAFGMEAIAAGSDVLCLGEMGIANTTSAAAICHALWGGTAADWVGRGSGVDDAGLARKVAAVEAAVDRHRAHLKDPLEVLRRLGGREIAALVGAILAARLARMPVVLDGYVVAAAAAVLQAMDATALDHCVAGHCSAEAPHRAALARLGKAPLLDLGLRLGEGSGAALALGVLRAAVACHAGMATFAQAGVAGRDEA
ncbi:MAG: nicotinate-nucleotide--dimethylbenzimidazole phosphoribosyltransferase [Methylobacteriaceae bacterium]|nr:nicotinate-nucleotide--dimethylbenzimidazole phosphoribosyltransferase [Methylobacteriaceae bacterium]